MTTLDDIPDLFPEAVTAPVSQPRKCRHPRPVRETHDGSWRCASCGHVANADRIRSGRRSRRRGNVEELTVARVVGGRKVGQMQQPWDVEMPGYARLQVKKLAIPPSLRTIAAELARIGSGAEMAGFVWIEPGRGGEKLIVFRLADFAERHGVEVEEAA